MSALLLEIGFASAGAVRIQGAGAEPYRSVWVILAPEAKGCSRGFSMKIAHSDTLEPSPTLHKCGQEK